MTWSLAYTQASGDMTLDSFMVYFMDTYLPSVPGFTTGPGGDAYERTVELTCNDIKGGTSTSYTWWNWSNDVSTNAYQYENEQYAVTPGDNGALASGNSLGLVSGRSGNWRIWASDERADGFLVTKGASGMLFWPGVGSGKWNLSNNNTWGPGDENSNTCIGFATNGYNGIPYCNNPLASADSSSEYQVVPSFSRVSAGNSTESNTYLYTGIGYQYSTSNLNSGLGVPSGHPCIPGGASDQAVLSPTTIATTGITMQLGSASLINDSVGGNYYYMLGSNLTYMTLCLDMGPTEPDFS